MAASSSSDSPKQVEGSGGKASSVHENGATGGAAAVEGSPSSSTAAAGSNLHLDLKDPPCPATNTNTNSPHSDGTPKSISAEEEVEEGASAFPQPVPATTAAAAPVVPTYESVEGSELYQTALALMKEGEFEDCIELVEQGMDELKEELLRGATTATTSESSSSSTATAAVPPSSPPAAASVDVHPSMAPYYYLYGTTLLYKVEEQDLNGPDGGAGAGVVVTDGAVAATPSEGDNNNDDDEDDGQEYYRDGDAAAEAGGGGSGDDNNNNNDEEGPDAAHEGDSDKVEDLQVAWEFLEAARGVLEKLLAADDASADRDKRRSDLAQVRKREGDLNRMNGQHSAAAADYQAALDYLKNSARVGPYDRKIADLHYNVGLMYTLEAAAAASSSSPSLEATTAPDPLVAALLPGLLSSAPPPTKVLSGRERAALRCRGVYHYWQCCKVLAWQVVTLCGIDEPSVVLERAERSVANLKSTGDGSSNGHDGGAAQGSHEGDQAEHPTIVSRKLSKLRADLTLHMPPQSEANGDDGRQEQMALAFELVQLLEDIQETIDEAERSEEGVQQVTEMKAEIAAAAAAAASASAANHGADGETGHGFGSAAAAATSAAAQPILAVKKKAKKREASEAGLKDPVDGSKRPAAE